MYWCEKKTEFPVERSFIGQSHTVCQSKVCVAQCTGRGWKQSYGKNKNESVLYSSDTRVTKETRKQQNEELRQKEGLESIRPTVTILGLLMQVITYWSTRQCVVRSLKPPNAISIDWFYIMPCFWETGMEQKQGYSDAMILCDGYAGNKI